MSIELYLRWIKGVLSKICLLALPFFTLTLLFASHFLILIANTDCLADDFYIHLRIARNFFEHGLPYYNLNDPLLSTSSPFYTGILAMLFSLSGYFSIYSIISFYQSLVITFSYFILNRLIHEVPLVMRAAVLIVIGAMLLGSALMGMEVPTLILVLSISLTLITKERFTCAGFVLSSLYFIRPEALLIALALLIVMLLNSEQKTKIIYAFTLGSIFCCVVLLIYYQSVIPNTIIAKQNAYKINFDFSLRSFRIAPFMPHFVHVPLLSCFFGIFALVNFARLKCPKHNLFANSGVAILFATLSIVAVFLLKKTLFFPWYTSSILIMVTLGIAMISTQLNRLAKFTCGTFLCIMAAVVVIYLTAALHNKFVMFSPFRENSRAIGYMNIGNRIQQCAPTANVLSSEIGGIGWGFKGAIFDAMGLASSKALYNLKHHPGKNPKYVGEIPFRTGSYSQADYLIGLDTHFRSDLREFLIASGYKKFEFDLNPGEPEISEIWANRKILVYERSKDYSRYPCFN